MPIVSRIISIPLRIGEFIFACVSLECKSSHLNLLWRVVRSLLALSVASSARITFTIMAINMVTGGHPTVDQMVAWSILKWSREFLSSFPLSGYFHLLVASSTIQWISSSWLLGLQCLVFWFQMGINTVSQLLIYCWNDGCPNQLCRLLRVKYSTETSLST